MLEVHRTTSEACFLCGFPLSRFQSHTLICVRCDEVVCRRCMSRPSMRRKRDPLCRKCEGSYN